MNLIMLMQQSPGRSWTWLVLLVVLLLCCAPMFWMMVRGRHNKDDEANPRTDRKQGQ